jgi:hypothetical protein
MTRPALRLLAATAVAGAVTSIAVGGAGASAGAAAPGQASGGCTLVSTSAGGIDVNAAGLATLHIDRIGLNVQLTGLPGTLLCSLLGGGVTGG